MNHLDLNKEETDLLHKALLMRTQNIQFQLADKFGNGRLNELMKELKSCVELLEKFEKLTEEVLHENQNNVRNCCK